LFFTKYTDSERLMSYIINNSRGQVLAVVADGTVNTTATDLSLVGRALTDYGTYENENYVFLLENFADSTAPLQPILGQLWYNSSTDVISTYGTGNAWIPIATQEYVQLQKVSTALTGVPTAPTAVAGTANTQLATTAFVTNSPQFSGIPTAPTAVAGTSTTQLATTAFVTASPALAGVPTAPTAVAGTSTTQLATTAFVTTGPQFSGIPTAPTAANSASSSELATTEFVQNQKVSPVFTGTPLATTATAGDSSTRIATTAFVQGEKNSPAFTGIPTAPTASIGTATTQLATTQFVSIALDPSNGSIGTMGLQNSNAVSITGGSISGISPLSISSGGTGENTAAGARNSLGLGSMATQNSNAVSITGGSIIGTVLSGGIVQALSSPIAVSSGGTGGNTAAAARNNLGLGDLATQNASNVNITGGSISGLASMIPVSSGGTGASTTAGARNNLGLGSMATQNSSAVSVSGGTLVGITQFNGSNVNITSGNISGLNSPIALVSGGTGATTATNARNNLGAAASTIQIIAGSGLTGGGTLEDNRTLSIATNSNGFGVRYVSTSAPTGGNNGDIWYQI
jgi:hypothetical protein